MQREEEGHCRSCHVMSRPGLFPHDFPYPVSVDTHTRTRAHAHAHLPHTQMNHSDVQSSSSIPTIDPSSSYNTPPSSSSSSSSASASQYSMPFSNQSRMICRKGDAAQRSGVSCLALNTCELHSTAAPSSRVLRFWASAASNSQTSPSAHTASPAESGSHATLTASFRVSLSSEPGCV
jgi:hypothetical protein